MQHTLMLLRHAKAVPWEPGVDDFARELAPRGRRHMERLAAWSAQHLAPPDRVLCSTSARTRGTLSPFLTLWPELERRVDYSDRLYHASAGTIHDLAARAFEAHKTVLMIGHNPGFEVLALGLMTPAESREHYKMATGTLGVFTFEDGFADGTPRLSHWVRRRDLSVD
jgi:phosphohistidine phosphatase